MTGNPTQGPHFLLWVPVLGLIGALTLGVVAVQSQRAICEQAASTRDDTRDAWLELIRIVGPDNVAGQQFAVFLDDRLPPQGCNWHGKLGQRSP